MQELFSLMFHHPILSAWVLCFALTIGFLCYAALSSPADDGRSKWMHLPIVWRIWLAPLIIFYPVDVILRLIWTLVCWEIPKTSNCTITAWCDSHCLDIDGASWRDWKRGIGRGICKVLCMFQPGHCPHYK